MGNLLSVFPLYARRVSNQQPQLKLAERCNELLEYCRRLPSIAENDNDDDVTCPAPKIRISNAEHKAVTARKKVEEEEEEEEEKDEEEEEAGQGEEEVQEEEDDAVSDISDSILLMAVESPAAPPRMDDDEDSQLVTTPTDEDFPNDGQNETASQTGKDINNNDTSSSTPIVITSTPVARAPRKLLAMQAAKRKFGKLCEQNLDSPTEQRSPPAGQKKTKLRRALFPKKNSPSHARKMPE